MSKENNYFVTTMDNVWNPFTHFKEWYAFDVQHGYNTCQWIDTLCKTSANLDNYIIEEDVAKATNEFLALNPYGMHCKVYENEAEKLISIMNEAYNSIKVK